MSSRSFGPGTAGRAEAVPPITALRLGTRGSQLALWQANAVAARIAYADALARLFDLGEREERRKVEPFGRPPRRGPR